MSAWLVHALVTTLLWGVWGALAGLPGEHGVPETLNYVVWALTMIPPAVFVLRQGGSALLRDRALGEARPRDRPARGRRAAGPVPRRARRPALPDLPDHLALARAHDRAVARLPQGADRPARRARHRARARGAAALRLPRRRRRGGYGLWFVLALAILVAWGVQAYVIKLANQTMDAGEHLLLHDAERAAAGPGRARDDRLLASRSTTASTGRASRPRSRS